MCLWIKNPCIKIQNMSLQVVPPDGGWGWVIVVASFMCNVLVDGIIFSGGLLLKHIQTEFAVSNYPYFYFSGSFLNKTLNM